MARNLVAGEEVFVPVSVLPDPSSFGTALIRRQVATVQNRSATITLPGGAQSPQIATSKLHRNLGILVLRIGDFTSESVVLDPLAKSILHFARLFLDDSFVHLLEARSVAEVVHWLPQNAARFSHVVLVGHCDAQGIHFGIGGACSADTIGGALNGLVDRLTFLSLACESGRASFAKPFSTLPFCEAFIAPYHVVHSVVASQFCQSFFANHFLEGRSLAVAHRDAREATPGSTSFRLWRAGEMS